MKKLRTGMRRDLIEIFEAARDMQGCGDPDLIDERKARIAELRKELFRILWPKKQKHKSKRAAPKAIGLEGSAFFAGQQS